MTERASGADQVDLVFWPVGLAISGAGLLDQLEAAHAGGFKGLAVAPMTIKRAVAAGTSIQDALDLAAERGLTFTHADGVSTWLNSWRPTDGSDITKLFTAMFDVPLEEALDLSQALGMQAIVAIGFFDEGAVHLHELVSSFAAACDSAKARGLRVDLEFIPTWGISELPLAWDIVKTAGRANAGICVDTWHLQKGSSDFERDMALLGQIPAERLRTIQLVDADVRTSRDLSVRGAVSRKFPGEGELDLTRIVSLIHGKGGLQSVGPEIAGGRLAGLTPREVGQIAGRTTRQTLSLALSDAAWPKL
jgi:sugar phosphate isomerase/epimerase